MKMESSFIDTHAHLTFSQFDKDRNEVMDRAWNAGLEYIITIGAGNGLDGNSGALELAKSHRRIFATVGIHPHDVAQMDEGWISKLRELAQNKRVVAIGEIGLDYYYKHSDPEVQRKRFAQLLTLADEMNKPVVIHDRDAHDDVWKIIKEVGVPKKGGVFHCFSGDRAFAEKLIEEGFCISIPGVVTFKNAHELQEVVATIPLERILIETDCPYLSPEPYRGKRNEPSYVVQVAEKIAELKGLALKDVARVTTLNAKRIFGLPGSEMETCIAYQIRNSMYLNITNTCNLACKFCPKFIDYEVKGHYLKLEHEPDVDDIFRSVGQPEKYDEIVFCGYGEPTRRLEVLKVIAQRMKERGVKKIRLNTDGLANLFYGRNVLPELKGLVDSISISLNAADAGFYSEVCRSKYGEKAYKAVCDFILEAKKYIPDVAISVVALPDLDLDACKAKAKELGVPMRIREYMNVG